MSYFEQIIFTPITKSVIIRKKDHFEFWFITKTNNINNSKKIGLMVRCPICDEAYVLREDVPSETIMRFALKENVNFYFDYVLEHCPKCHPNHPPDHVFLSKYNIQHPAS